MPFVFAAPPPQPSALRSAIRQTHLEDEDLAAARILAAAEMPADMRERIAARASGLVALVPRERVRAGGIDALLHEYALSSPEGVALMCLAEALLRIPDSPTVGDPGLIATRPAMP